MMRGATLAAVCLLLAGCGSGRSILEAGNEPAPTVATTTSLATTTTTERIGPPQTTPDGGTVAPPPPFFSH